MNSDARSDTMIPVRPIENMSEGGGHGDGFGDVKENAEMNMPIAPVDDDTMRRDNVEQEQQSDDDMMGEGSGDVDVGIRIPKAGRDPRGPTRAERLAHNLTHIPYRSWCKHCVRGKAKEDAHKVIDPGEDEDEQRLPHFCMDYCFYTKGGRPRERGGQLFLYAGTKTRGAPSATWSRKRVWGTVGL